MRHSSTAGTVPLLIAFLVLAAGLAPAVAAHEHRASSAPDVLADAGATFTDPAHPGVTFATLVHGGPLEYNMSRDLVLTNLTGVENTRFSLRAGEDGPLVQSGLAVDDLAHGPGRVNVTWAASSITATNSIAGKFNQVGPWFVLDEAGAEVAAVRVDAASDLVVTLSPADVLESGDALTVRASVTREGTPVPGVLVDFRGLGGSVAMTNADGDAHYTGATPAVGTYTLGATLSTGGNAAPEHAGSALLTVHPATYTALVSPERIPHGVTSAVTVRVVDDEGAPAPGRVVAVCGAPIGSACTRNVTTDADGAADFALSPFATGSLRVLVDGIAHATITVYAQLYLSVTPDPAFAQSPVYFRVTDASGAEDPYADIRVTDTGGAHVWAWHGTGVYVTPSWTPDVPGEYVVTATKLGYEPARHDLTVLSESGFEPDDPHGLIETRLSAKLDALEGRVRDGQDDVKDRVDAAAAEDARRDGRLSRLVASTTRALQSSVDGVRDALNGVGAAVDGVSVALADFRASVTARFDALTGRVEHVQDTLDARPLDVALVPAGGDARAFVDAPEPRAPDAVNVTLPAGGASAGPAFFALVTLDGVPVDAELVVRVDGARVNATVTALSAGTYRVTLPAPLTGSAHALVVEAAHAAPASGATHHGAALTALPGAPVPVSAPDVPEASAPDAPDVPDAPAVPGAP